MARLQTLSRGRGSGALLMLLGAWGALVPFVGPYFGYAYTPDKSWAYNSGRLYLSILPGAAALLGGAIVVASRRAGAVGGLLAAVGGAWFVIGQQVTSLAASSITPGSPAVAGGDMFGAATMKFLEGLGFFYGLGVVIVFFAALAIGRAASANTAMARDQAQPFTGADETAPYATSY